MVLYFVRNKKKVGNFLMGTFNTTGNSISYHAQNLPKDGRAVRGDGYFTEPWTILSSKVI